MKRDYLIEKLKAKALQIDAENHKYDDRIKLSRKLWYSNMRKEMANMRKISAINAAITLIVKGFMYVDVYDAVLMTIANTRLDKDALLQKAMSNYLCEQKQALKEVFETSLPICKNQVLSYL